MKKIYTCIIAFVILLLASIFLPMGAHTAYAATDEWGTSFHDVQRDSVSNDTTFSASNAGKLQVNWKFKAGGPISAGPTVVNNILYVGSWDGYEYAINATTGTLIWKTYLGITIANSYCIPPALGVASTATVQNGVVYVGGGDDNFYALNATNGTILWSVPTGDNSAAGGHFNWSSPLIVNGYAYVGIASLGDCPLVQGLLLKVDLAHHLVVAATKIVPDGQVGGGIWSSPAYDPVTNKIFVATGTENATTQTYAQAMLAIDASTMQIVDYWKLPESVAVLDSDFGTSAIIYTDSSGRQLITAINKNGIAYTFNRNNLAAGPLWQQDIAIGGDCPTCSVSSVSTPTVQNGTIFLSGEAGKINGFTYPGTVRAVNAATGNLIWQHGANGPILPALSSANGLVFDAAGSVLEVLDATNGNRLFSYDTGSGIYSPTSVANGSIYFGNLAGNIISLGLPGSNTTPPNDPNCPAGFTCQDIGNPGVAGSETVTNGNWSVTASGNGITGTADGFRFLSESVSGNNQLSAQVTASSAQTGLMLRQTNTPDSPYYAVFINKNNTVTIQYRNAFSGNTTTLNTVQVNGLPLYLSIQRNGDTFQAATSTDGNTFTLIPGSTTTLSLPTNLLGGVAISSDNNTASQAAILSHLTFTDSTSYTQPTTQNPCPVGWNCQDIGNPVLIGDQTLANNTFTLKGSGGDIWEDTDTFHYVWKTLAGDATISTRVTSQQNTDPYAKAGLMMRLSADPAAANYSVFVTPSNGVIVQYRTQTGFISQEAATTSGVAPQYIQIARSGDDFTAYTSTNGTNWIPVPGSTVTLDDLSGQLLAGFAVTAHNIVSVGAASFDSFAITNSAPLPPGLCPQDWKCEDIGNPTPQGTQSETNGTWTIDGGGNDIWGTTDAFHYVFQPLTGDGSVSAQISSQTNSDPWAKAGLMIRTTDDPGSAYYAILTTPQNGTIIQYRLTQGSQSNQLTVTNNKAPIYARINKTGTMYSASLSSNGTDWTPIPNSSVTISPLTESVLAGMAVTSHNYAQASETVVNNFLITDQSTSASCPAYWSCADIGNPAVGGSTNYANNVFTLKGGGNDIWQNEDQFQYAYQNLTGDGTITAEILSQSNTDPWAKAGVMIRTSAAANTNYALLAVTPGNGLHMQSNFTNDISGGIYTFPIWVQLKRTGNTITSYSSNDGTHWTQIGQTTIAMPATVAAGLFDTSHNGNALSTVAFANVSITAGGSDLPAPWGDTDIGNPKVTGSALYSNSTFTINGAGNDIWGTDDQFNFVNQPLTGDGSIVSSATFS